MTFMEDIAVLLDAQRSVNNISYALKELLQRANKSGRVVVGVMECVQILQSNPDEVNLCILTETDDVTAQIHHKLVEAFCWENDIEVIKVDNNKKMEKVLSRNETFQNVVDIGCVLIKNAETDNFTNEFMENYYSMLRGVRSPIIDLPE